MRELLFSFVGLFVLGCAAVRPPSDPMPAVFHTAPEERGSGLIVFVPGFGDGPEDFARGGFVEQVRRANPGFDVIAADAHFGYYREGFIVVDRLHRDLIAPVADRYDQVWLVGISMGGLGAAAYAMEHPEVVDGLILLAPFLGSREVIEQVKQAGGLREWVPPADIDSIEGDRRRKYFELWSWYKRYVTSPSAMPALYLGCGEEDRLTVPTRLVAEVLPEEHWAARPGGHRWSTWTPLFETLSGRALSALP